jgi:geranylgeranyl reductase family protein
MSPSATPEVIVVGGGPAGTSSAITLRRAGRCVLLLDKAAFPRDKICGDGLTTGALRLLDDLGLDPASVPSWRDVHNVRLSTPRRRVITLPLPDDGGRFAAVARRAELDAALVDLARSEGVQVREQCSVTDAGTGDALAWVVADGERLEAPYVIAADGMWSTVRKALGAGEVGYRGDWHAFRQYVTGVSPQAASELMVWFEPDFLPGYAWSFPVGDGGANIGFGVLRGSRFEVPAMKTLWRELLARPHIQRWLGPHATPEGPHRAWPIPARVGQLPLSAGRVLFVGDAAAVTDPLTGEGIGQALATGRWAAEAIATAGPYAPATAASRYEHQVHDLVVDHAMSELLVRALRHRTGVRVAVALAGATPWTRRNFARWLFEDYPRALIVTPRRWHRGMFTGPGAYQSKKREATSA